MAPNLATRFNAARARQGRLGRDVFWVLLISTFLAFVALLASWGWNAGRLAATEPDHDAKAATAQTFDAAAP
ncbi:hypothetical protein [Phenylobacterium sp.]|uniref:hypothetical protein n=1 Tax=Phenylobacterium sp. TaxID=1871053 RepID=UPI0035ADA4AE